MDAFITFSILALLFVSSIVTALLAVELLLSQKEWEREKERLEQFYNDLDDQF